MPYTESVNGLIDEYIEKSRSVIANSRPGDGLMGFGNDPKKNPCHMEFYESMERLINEMAASSPDPGEASSVAEILIKAPETISCPDMCRWTLVAARQLAIPLIPYVTPEAKAELKAWFNDFVPRRERLPVEKKLYSALSE